MPAQVRPLCLQGNRDAPDFKRWKFHLDLPGRGSRGRSKVDLAVQVAELVGVCYEAGRHGCDVVWQRDGL